MDNKIIPKNKTPLKDPVELLESSLSIWWKNIKPLLLIYWQGLKKSLIPIIILLFFDFFQKQIDTSSLLLAWAYVLIISLSYLLVFYYLIRSQITLFLFIKNKYQGNVSQLFKSSYQLFWPYLGLSLLSTLIIIAGFIAFIIPGIILITLYALAAYVFFVENKRGMSALNRSKDLVKSYFWPVLGRILFIILVAIVFSTITSLPLLALNEGSFLFNFWNLFLQVLSLAVAPVSLIYFYKIYQELSEVKN